MLPGRSKTLAEGNGLNPSTLNIVLGPEGITAHALSKEIATASPAGIIHILEIIDSSLIEI
jgi:hypothetical protein